MNLIDLPDTALLTIFVNIENIREKIRLLQVCQRFRQIGLEALKNQAYKIVNKDDYMYQSEIVRNPEPEEVIVPLNQLIKVAPKLTHLVDKVYHIGFNKPDDKEDHEALDLPHLKYIYIDLCRKYFFNNSYSNYYRNKINTFLEKCPKLRTLDVRCDSKLAFTLPESPNLKTLRLDHFNHFRYTDSPSGDIFFGILDGKAGNLEELSVTTQYGFQDDRFNRLIQRIFTNCPNLRSLKLFFQENCVGASLLSYARIYGPFDELRYLEYLDIRGIRLTEESWSDLLASCPNLKFLVVHPETAEPMIQRVVRLHCSKVRVELERPFEIEEEFRVYNYKKLSSDSGRFL